MIPSRGRPAALLLLFVTLAFALPARSQTLPAPPGWQLERVVLMSRHGVRAPIHTAEELRDYAASPWPRWPVGPGELTPHGAALMRLMGAYYRALYGAAGLVPGTCPPAGSVVAWSDTDQRTRLSAESVLEGLYPGCGLHERHLADGTRDPLFRPFSTAACFIDAVQERMAILERVGGGFGPVLGEYAAPLTALQNVLCPPGHATGGHACGLGWPIPRQRMGARGFALWSPISRGGRASEIFLLQTAEDFPADEVAWGRLGADRNTADATLREVLAIRRLEFDLLERTPLMARHNGSALLARILSALEDGQSFPGRSPAAQPVRLGLLVGHDSNIANLAGLLHLAWEIPSLQPNDPSPGGALAFELWRETASGRRYVRLSYSAQTVEQMRQAAPLDLQHPPGVAAVALPACAAEQRAGACPLERFAAIVRTAVEPGCTAGGTVK